MPVTLVSAVAGRTAAEKRALMEAVQGAIVKGLKLPPHDRYLRLAEHAPDEWLLPEGKSGRFVLIEIALFEGRTPETKGALYAEIVAALEGLGMDRNDVFIRLIEQPRENFGIRGGQRADLVQLGYEVKV
ncbi:MAG: tautomerase family protein [Desulfovibrio sp.]|jgi:phenylpyruvate tautomerase PptA (4-oxalocrotonate tautomerase family)|nr:tautomerase family protein [Desulfovibrio sp.]